MGLRYTSAWLHQFDRVSDLVVNIAMLSRIEIECENKPCLSLNVEDMNTVPCIDSRILLPCRLK